MSDEKMTGRHFSGTPSASDEVYVGKRFAPAAPASEPAIEPAAEPAIESDVVPAIEPDAESAIDSSVESDVEPDADFHATEACESVDERADECVDECGAEDDDSAAAAVDGDGDAAATTPEDADASDDDGAPKEPVKAPKRRIAMRVLVGIVLILAVGLAAGAVFINQSIARGRKAFEESMNQTIEEKGKTVEHNGKTYHLNKNMVSIAFIGFDNRTTNSASGMDASGQSDTIMVIALNTDTGAATGIVIPRDSMVDVDTYISGNFNGTHTMQICLQYSYGSTSEESSELVARCASRVLYGMPVDYYFTLNVEGVGPLNDAVGGVTLVPVQSVPSVGISEGVETTLYGKTAERYVQFRDTSTLTSSLDRQRRQVSYLKAFSSKVLQSAASDPAVLLNLYQTAQDYTWTNLGFDQFSYLVSTMLSHGMTSFNVVTLDGQMGEGETYAEFHLDHEAVYQAVLDTYYTPVDK